MTDPPTTPAECRAEQERVLALLEGTTPGEWASSEGDPDRPADVYVVNPQHPDDAGMGKLLALTFTGTGKSGRVASAGWDRDYAVGNAALLAAAPTLARDHAALLADHAEALEREARIMAHFQAAHDALQRRADEGRIDFNIAARVVEAQLEAAKRSISPAPASAGGEG